MSSARSETVHGLIAFAVKTWIGGFASAWFLALALGAGVLDALTGRGRADGWLGVVLRTSAAFHDSLDVHGARAAPGTTTADDATRPAARDRVEA